ncbi:MAG TPA: TldD/PmbA family protein, partial [Thermodesulfobacteriota bacterium]|nr:TldD/PmbA family protein [Thermodesulfobacteriota bacterium]
MKDWMLKAIDLARVKKADYADVRLVHRHTEEIAVKDGRLDAWTKDEDIGFGIRVLFQGAWGFASSSKVTAREMERTLNRAWKMARESSRFKGSGVFWRAADPAIGTYETPISVDPFRVSPEKKIHLLLDAEALLRKNGKVKISEAFMASFRTVKTFVSTEGSDIEQTIVECGAGISATAIQGSDVQVRSYPNSFRGNFSTAGYEWIEGLKLEEHAEPVAEESVRLLSAKPCPSTTTTVILDASQLALQVHESIGHPIELDRILGSEASYAGTSFLGPERVGNFQYGSGKVNVVADATTPGGLGTFGFDDEGVKAQRIPILSGGRLVNLLTSRETAPLIGKESNGTMRADGWSRIPLIRMTNINLEPGDWTLEAMIADTEEGLFLSTNRSWSIDD